MKVLDLPCQNDVCRTYGIIIRIRAPTKTNPSRIALYEMLVLSYPSVQDPVQYPQ